MAFPNISSAQNGSNCKPKDKDWTYSFVPAYIMIIFLLGIILNGFVLFVYTRKKKTQNNTYRQTKAQLYLSNLLFSDILLLLWLPFWFVYVLNKFNWTFGKAMCKIINGCIRMSAYCNIFFLVLISIDRYLVVVHSMRFGENKKKSKIVCLLIWFLGFLLSVPTIIFRETKTEDNITVCYENYKNNTHLEISANLCFIFLGFLIPTLITCFFTVSIIIKLRQSFQKSETAQETEQFTSQRLQNPERRRSDQPSVWHLESQKHGPKENPKNSHVNRKAVDLILAVFLSFLICWGPFNIIKIWNLLNECTYISYVSSQLTVYLGFFNSVLNPILYVMVGKNFKGNVKQSFSLKTVPSWRNNNMAEKGNQIKANNLESSDTYFTNTALDSFP